MSKIDRAHSNSQKRYMKRGRNHRHPLIIKPRNLILRSHVSLWSHRSHKKLCTKQCLRSISSANSLRTRAKSIPRWRVQKKRPTILPLSREMRGEQQWVCTNHQLNWAILRRRFPQTRQRLESSGHNSWQPEGDSQSSQWRRPTLDWRSQRQTSNFYRWKYSWVPRQWSPPWPKMRRLSPRGSPIVYIQGSFREHLPLSRTSKLRLRTRLSLRCLTKSLSLTLQCHPVLKKHPWCKPRKSSLCRSLSDHRQATPQHKRRRRKRRKKRRNHSEWSSKST